MRFTHPAIGAGAATAAVLVALTSCSSGAPAPTTTDLRLGIIGSADDTATPYTPTQSTSQFALREHVYDGLTYAEADGTVVMALAESMEPNADLTEWTIAVRPGVVAHDGSAFDADDVVSSIREILDPETSASGARLLDFIDPARITKVDELTVTLGLNRPTALVPDVFSNERVVMRADGADGEPVGTGPFTLDQFTPGQQASLTRFDDFWGDAPAYEHLTIRFFQDQQAVTNALRGGQIDIADHVPFSEVESLEGEDDLELLISDTNAAPTLSFRRDLPPFDDDRVYEAMRLILDREQFVTNAFNGFATVGTDALGPVPGCPAPDFAAPEPDPERAKALLAEAGQSGLSFELVTDGADAGMAESAQLFAQQAAEAGVTVEVRQMDVASFLAKWGEWPAYIGAIGGPYSTAARNYYLPGQSNNATHFDDPEYTALADEYASIVQPEERCDVAAKMQRIAAEHGGNLMPALSQNVTAYRAGITGLEDNVYGRTGYRLRHVALG